MALFVSLRALSVLSHDTETNCQMCPLALLFSQIAGMGCSCLILASLSCKPAHVSGLRFVDAVKNNMDRQRIELWTFRMQSEHSTTELRAPRRMLISIIPVGT